MRATAPVAAVVPLFNGRRFLREAIDSILAQQSMPREIVVVDDGSTDDGGSLLAAYPAVRVVRQPNGGEAAARNRGIRETREPLIAFLDQDDRWLPRNLAFQVRVLEADPSIDFTYGQHRLIVEDGARWFRQDALGKVLTAELPGCMVVRRDAFERIGPYREDMERGSDVDWILRAQDAGIKSQLVEEVLLLRRMHRANSSIAESLFMSNLLRAARASVQRKRLNSGGPAAGRKP
ncbi:MAG TPA: glycosyltransferase family A protein [Candidatus Udaeobacter sp.]|nr:glycosyltransferase family A protein [Candidatus Udaeobacter sp.]